MVLEAWEWVRTVLTVLAQIGVVVCIAAIGVRALGKMFDIPERSKW